MRIPRWILPCCLGVALAWSGCSGENGGESLDAAWDTAAVPDVDEGSGTPGGGSSGGMMGMDGGSVPETEVTLDYRTPCTSGRWVFIPNPSDNALIALAADEETLVSIPVGDDPVHVVPLDDAGTVAVLAAQDDEVNIVTMNADNSYSVASASVRPDTNALAASPDGAAILAFFDTSLGDSLLGVRTVQEASIVDVATLKSHHFTVGNQPYKAQFAADNSAVFVLTQDHIDMIDLAQVADQQLPVPIALYDVTATDPDAVEVQISPDGRWAIGRSDTSSEVRVVDTRDPNTVRTYALPAVATDLDIAPDGTFAALTMRSESRLAILALPLEDPDAADPFSYVDLEGRVAGAASIAPDSRTMALYTTVARADNPNAQRTLTIATWNESGWSVAGTLVDRPIHTLVFAPDSDTIVVQHAPATTTDTEQTDHGAVTVVRAQTGQNKAIALQSELVTQFFAPRLHRAYLLEEKAIHVINLQTFIADTVTLGSPALTGGFVDASDTVYVVQSHPAGRITFTDGDGGAMRTVTGYYLNQDIVP